MTPIRSGDGELVSVVVTMQDLAPLEELERQRADFLRMVSHELRAPLASIKGSAGTVLEASPAASRAEMLEFFRLINGQANHMRGLIANLLDAAGWTALPTGDPQQLGRLIEAERPDLVLLDLVLPGTDGIELMQRIPELAELPVIFISGYGNDATIAQALELGAADCIVKPFSPTELVARVRAALRRRDRPEAFVLDELRIRYDQRRVTVAGRKIDLTATEYELLRVLPQSAGRVVSCDRLLRTVWGRRESEDPGPVRTYVKKLRRKLGDDAASPAYILTERGVGYRMPAGPA